MKRVLFYIFIISCCLLTACDKCEDDSQIIDYVLNEDLLECLHSDSHEGNIFIVSNQNEFSDLFKNHKIEPYIDFSRYNLVIAVGRAPNGIVQITKELTQSENSLNLDICILTNLTCEAPQWCVGVLIEKAYTGNIGLHVKYEIKQSNV